MTDNELKAELYRTVSDYVSDYRELVEEGIPGIAETLEDPLTGEEVGFPSPYQIEEAKFLRDNGRVLIADDMGTGKTAAPVLGHYLIDDIDSSLIVAPGYLRDHWSESIQEFTSDEPSVHTVENYDGSELKRIGDTDFTVMNYSIFGRDREDIIDAVLDAEFDLVALDEAHNIKNTDSKTSQNVTEISEDPEYLCMLSGTPVPNDLNDTYALVYLLEHENYEDSGEVRRKHFNQPRTVRSVMNRRRISWDLEDIVDMPELRDHQEGTEGEILLEGLHRDVYEAILENDTMEGKKKMNELLKATLDPSLVDPDTVYSPELSEKLETVPSTKYGELGSLVEEMEESGEKAVVYTPHFVDGVTDRLVDEFDEFNPFRIDGDVPQAERPGIVDSFEQSDSSLLIATTRTAGEGLDVTEASNVVFLHEPWTPAEREQAIKRVWRRGQENDVDVYSLTAGNTVDEGILELLEQKEEAIEFVEKGLEMSDEQLELLLNNSKQPVREKIYTPQQKALWYYSRLSGEDVGTVWENMSRNDFEIARDIAENHSTDWEESYSANSARMYSKIVEQAADDGRVVDLGSGHGALSEFLDTETTNVDINRFNFLNDRSDPEDDNVAASIHQLPFTENSFDIAVSSLSLHYTSPEGSLSEREQAVMEANRVLKEDGKYIVTLPASLMDEDSIHVFQEELQQYGFEVDEKLSGIVRSGDEDVHFETSMVTATKRGQPEKGGEDVLDFEDRSKDGSQPGMKNRGRVDEFVIDSLEGEISLEKAVEQTI